MTPIASSVGKTDAVADLARQSGLIDFDPYGSNLDRLFDGLSPRSNRHIGFGKAAALGIAEQQCFAELHRPIHDPVYCNGRPDSFPATTGSETSPAFKVATIPGGVFAHVARAPVAFLSNRRTVVANYSSRYARLGQFYDVDLTPVLADARLITGTALILSDDIFPINYCHWLIDTLPRLAFLGERRDVTIVVNDQDTAFRQDSLRLCGVDASRVVALPDFSAICADTLLVPEDTRTLPHPAHKAAPWVLHFLRARVGFAALASIGAAFRPRKLYVSRADAAGRRVLNEAALVRLLASRGYHRASMSGLSLADQVALFAGATHIVGLHGAGLANIAFSPKGARVLEIFPASYGMPSYYVLAAGQGHAYASYIATDVRSGTRTQLDDVVIDVTDFEQCCAEWL